LRTVTAASLLAAFAFVFPVGALGATSAGLPFPSNLLTTPDSSQITGLHVDLPKPDCSQRPSDCADVDVLNTLDGFNIQPRISIPFSGPIDPATVSSKTVFLVGPRDHVVGINQAVWEPAANTLHVESDEQLVQDSTYLLVVSKGLHAADGTPIKTTFRHDLNFGQTNDPATKAYRKALLDALPMALAGGVDPDDIADASLFTTQSITAISRKIRTQIQAGTPAPATFTLGPGGTRTVFPAETPIKWHRDRVPLTTPPTPIDVDLPTGALFVFPGSVASVAFGSYASPDYETAAKVIPAVGTATGTPVQQGTNQIQFTLFVPSGPKPAGGWPVTIFGHGFTDSKNGAPWVVASSLAHAGLATIAINVVGHGFGPLGTYTATTPAGLVTFPAGGRGIDQNGNGTIDSTEGVNAAAPQALVGNRDGLRQTVVDIMQLVREIQVRGIDFDGDGSPDLSPARIYYAGQSFGGIYGVQLLGLEPDIRAGVPNVPGGPIIEIARLSPSFRGLVGFALSPFSRTPPLYNVSPPDAGFTNFNENIPLRNLPIVTDTVPGASAIQEYIDRAEWAQQAGNPAAYAPYITRPIIIQFARGDKTVPNPTTSAILRACGCAARATLFRNDLAFAANPATPKNPHTFLTNIFVPSVALYAIEAQTQMATFLASDGVTTIDPDGAPDPTLADPTKGLIFETPTSMVPEDLAFIP
jgi:Bacterial Ig-like domain